jgi:uncharacterized protein YegJ (DUF2314 family)
MRTAIVLTVVLALSGCGRSSDNVVKRSGEPDMISVTADDSAMNAAIERARASLPAFRAALASHPAGSDGFAVKVALSYGKDGGEEHIWLVDPSLAANTVSGIVNNEPVHATHLKLGQRLTAPVADVSDWMYAQHGVLKGGETIRVLVSRMSPEERKDFVASTGLRLE